MTGARPVLYAVHCPLCEWTRTDPGSEQDATDTAGAHDDARHGGEPTTVLVAVLTVDAWQRATTVDPGRADAVFRRVVAAAITAS